MKTFPLAKNIIALLVACLFSCPVFSNDDDPDSGGYVGARVGYSHNERSCMDTMVTCDKDDTGYGLFAGYDFNRHIALELSFNDIGDSVAKYPSTTLEGKLREADLALKIAYPLYKQSRLYGKLGAAYWEGEVTGRNPTLDDSGVRPLIGGGVEFPFADRWAARLEYQYIDQVGNDVMGHTNPHFFGVSLVWNFASRARATPVAMVTEHKPQAIAIAPEPAPEQRIVIDEQLGGPLFEFDKSIIRNTAAIDPVIDVLMKTPSLNVSIIGHTDARGTAEYNQRLSEARANVVAKYLRSKGVMPNRIKVYGMGEDQPVADNQTEEGRAKNRRVEFVISGTKTL
jgi:OOP family OmpA-OmpF porin